jgi:hypothetical protein
MINQIINTIIDDLRNNPYLILSENDLACQIYMRLLQKNVGEQIFTEWSIKTKRTNSERRIGRYQYDLVTCKPEAITYNGKNELTITKFSNVLELKVHWQTSPNHMFNKIMESDIHRLRYLRKDRAENKFMIAVNLYTKDIDSEKLDRIRDIFLEDDIELIYHFVNTRELIKNINKSL